MTITILTQESCPSCVTAKTTLAQIQGEYPVDVVEIPLATDEGRELANRLGIVFAPGILIDGKLFSYGRLSEKKLRRHLLSIKWPTEAANQSTETLQRSEK